MTKEEIAAKVKSIAAKYLCEDENDIQLDANIREEYGGDSLDIVQIVMDVEHAFSISISDEAADSINTVQDIVDEVKRHILD
jgi:acyl carrier protein